MCWWHLGTQTAMRRELPTSSRRCYACAPPLAHHHRRTPAIDRSIPITCFTELPHKSQPRHPANQAPDGFGHDSGRPRGMGASRRTDTAVGAAHSPTPRWPGHPAKNEDRGYAACGSWTASWLRSARPSCYASGAGAWGPIRALVVAGERVVGMSLAGLVPVQPVTAPAGAPRPARPRLNTAPRWPTPSPARASLEIEPGLSPHVLPGPTRPAAVCRPRRNSALSGSCWRRRCRVGASRWQKSRSGSCRGWPLRSRLPWFVTHPELFRLFNR